jgi:coenzyme PQQ precursor peptide PqqA
VKWLIAFWFDTRTRPYLQGFLALQQMDAEGFMAKNSLANFLAGTSLMAGRKFVHLQGEAKMAWKTPKIVEVPVGMEINMYACAARK